MVQHKAYRIYRRKTARRHAGRPVYRYYYALWDYENLRYGPARSTGQTNRTDAERWLARHLEAKQREHPSRLTVRQFAEGMYDVSSEYLTYKLQRGRDLSRSHRQHCATYLKNYILPYFGQKQVSAISMLDIEAFQGWLLQQPGPNGTLTPTTANHVVQALRSVVKWAIHQRALTHDPFVGVEPLATQPNTTAQFPG